MKIKIIALMTLSFILIWLFNGCSLRVASIESLIRPPKLTGDHASLQEAFESNFSQAITLKTPVAGTPRSSYVFHDINNDGLEEAFVFYSYKSFSTDIRMNMLINDGNGNWKSVADIQGSGSEVYSINFVDMNSDNIEEVLVSWRFAESKGNKYLSVYSYEEKNNNTQATLVAVLNEQYTEMITLDMDLDNKNDLFLSVIDMAAFDSGVGKSLAKLLYFDIKDGGLAAFTKGSISLDPRAVSYKSLKYDVYSDSGGESPYCRVYLDAETADSNVMFTEIVSWDAVNKRIVSPLQVDGQITRLRSIKTESRDIDNDGIIEVPSFITIEEAEKTKNSIGIINVWSKYTGDSGWEVSLRYIENSGNKYNFIIPDEWVGSFTASLDNSNNKMTFYELSDQKKGESLFEIFVYSNSNWLNITAEDLDVVKIHNNMYYVCRIYEKGEDRGIDAEFIKEHITLVE